MNAKTYFSAITATVLMTMGASSALAQQTGEIRFYGEIVNGSCSPIDHVANAYTAKEKLKFDLGFNNCLEEIQQAVGVSVQAMHEDGERLDVTMNTLGSGLDIVLSPLMQSGQAQRNHTSFHMVEKDQATSLGIRYRDAAGQLTAATEKVYVILNLQYV
ncbi:hypothetical protein ACLPHM_05245 [Paenalcaligenes sp. Me131]|uniref:hypothetical protein n=1 Tax=Paenalcaligenes sp. Me131 TaxID=3392636 RepID=UPI003D26F8AF